MPQEKKPEPKRTFRHAMTLLCEKYGFADWAVCARAVDGSKESFWDAGDGNNPIGDRERAGLLLYEMEELKASIVDFGRGKR